MSAYGALSPAIQAVVDRHAELVMRRTPDMTLNEARELIAREVRTTTVRPSSVGH